MLVEQKVWDTCWVPDHLRGMPPFAIDEFLSPWSMLGAFTELAPELRLGVAVTDGIRLHPAVLAQVATSLDHQSNGRFILGIGAGEKMNLTAYGFDKRQAVSRMRECIEVMQLLWSQTDPIDFSGQFYQLRRAVLIPKPVQQPSLPVWVAGNGPVTRRITAELGDGWFPFPGIPRLYKKGLLEIQQHMKKLGRDLSALAHGFWGRVYMHEDSDKVSSYVNRYRGDLALQPWLLRELGYWRDDHAQIYLEQGLDPVRLSLLTYDADDIARLDINKLLPIVSDIPEKVIQTVLLAGTPEEITQKLKAFIEAGVQHFCFEIINGTSRRNAPFTYWDVSRILAEEVYPAVQN